MKELQSKSGTYEFLLKLISFDKEYEGSFIVRIEGFSTKEFSFKICNPRNFEMSFVIRLKKEVFFKIEQQDSEEKLQGLLNDCANVFPEKWWIVQIFLTLLEFGINEIDDPSIKFRHSIETSISLGQTPSFEVKIKDDFTIEMSERLIEKYSVI